MTISPFHRIKNAKSALNHVQERDDVEIEHLDEQLGSVELGIRFTEDASMKALRGVDEMLTDAGYEEESSESEIGGVLQYTWDRTYLTVDDPDEVHRW